VTRRDYRRERQVPAQWVAEFARVTSTALLAWQDARGASDFARFQPHLERIVAMRREYAGFFAPYASIYDPLLDTYEPGMKTAEVRVVFATLRPPLVALVQKVGEHAGAVDDSCLKGDFDELAQWDLGLQVLRRIGYDFDRGRQDRSAHPFTTAFSRDDVRITTRVLRQLAVSSLFSSIHEGGHALYEQGIDPALARTPLGSGTSLGIHESQSRLWENLIGRSFPFWKVFYPAFQSHFPQMRAVPLEQFYRAINKVTPSPIRVEADEVTYNLHVMLRFELELALLEGELAVRDLPAAWNDRTREFLGILPPDDAQGVLQDIHWSMGDLGYFPTYTLGNLVSVLLYDCALEQKPSLGRELEQGEYSGFLGWLRENVHRHGAKFEPLELLRRVTGGGLRAEPYLEYLTHKYGEIYGFSG
jgi:carboxypeptidase Taq